MPVRPNEEVELVRAVEDMRRSVEKEMGHAGSPLPAETDKTALKTDAVPVNKNDMSSLVDLGKVDLVKSKFGLGFVAVLTVVLSLIMSVGLCGMLGVEFSIVPWEVFPFLIIAVGVENMFTITSAVVNTSMDLPVKERVGRGLGSVGVNMFASICVELAILLVGSATNIPAFQEFSLFAAVAILMDYFLQLTFFTTVLSIDIRRLELSDLQNRRVAAIIRQHSSADVASLGASGAQAEAGSASPASKAGLSKEKRKEGRGLPVTLNHTIMILLLVLIGVIAYEILFVQSRISAPSPISMQGEPLGATPTPTSDDTPLSPDPRAVRLYERLFEVLGWEQEPWGRHYEFTEVAEPWEVSVNFRPGSSDILRDTDACDGDEDSLLLASPSPVSGRVRSRPLLAFNDIFQPSSLSAAFWVTLALVLFLGMSILAFVSLTSTLHQVLSDGWGWLADWWTQFWTERTVVSAPTSSSKTTREKKRRTPALVKGHVSGSDRRTARSMGRPVAEGTLGKSIKGGWLQRKAERKVVLGESWLPAGTHQASEASPRPTRHRFSVDVLQASESGQGNTGRTQKKPFSSIGNTVKTLNVSDAGWVAWNLAFDWDTVRIDDRLVVRFPSEVTCAKLGIEANKGDNGDVWKRHFLAIGRMDGKVSVLEMSPDGKPTKTLVGITRTPITSRVGTSEATTHAPIRHIVFLRHDHVSTGGRARTIAFVTISAHGWISLFEIYGSGEETSLKCICTVDSEVEEVRECWAATHRTLFLCSMSDDLLFLDLSADWESPEVENASPGKVDVVKRNAGVQSMSVERIPIGGEQFTVVACGLKSGDIVLLEFPSLNVIGRLLGHSKHPVQSVFVRILPNTRSNCTGNASVNCVLGATFGDDRARVWEVTFTVSEDSAHLSRPQGTAQSQESQTLKSHSSVRFAVEKFYGEVNQPGSRDLHITATELWGLRRRKMFGLYPAVPQSILLNNENLKRVDQLNGTADGAWWWELWICNFGAGVDFDDGDAAESARILPLSRAVLLFEDPLQGIGACEIDHDDEGDPVMERAGRPGSDSFESEGVSPHFATPALTANPVVGHNDVLCFGYSDGVVRVVKSTLERTDRKSEFHSAASSAYSNIDLDVVGVQDASRKKTQ
ncbi:hypothetical protein HDU93_006411 [Gonapodya sp. JEL0774]|nr:hypothetical protein HDU93_006411 [Gonapodya sp. JEL0774]